MNTQIAQAEENNKKVEEKNKISFEEFNAKIEEFLTLVNALFESLEPEIGNNDDLNDIYKSFYLLKYDVLSEKNIKDIYDKDLENLFLDRINTFKSVLLGLQVELSVNTANRDYAKDKVRKNTRDIALNKDSRSKFKKSSKARKKAIFSAALALSIIVNSSIVSDLFINRKEYFPKTKKSTKIEEVIDKNTTDEDKLIYYNGEEVLEGSFSNETQYTYKNGYDKIPNKNDELVNNNTSEVGEIEFKYATTTSYRVVQKIPNTENYYIIEDYSPVQTSGYRYRFVYYATSDSANQLLNQDLGSQYMYHYDTIYDNDFRLSVNRDAHLVVRSYDVSTNESTFDYYSNMNLEGKRIKKSKTYKHSKNISLVPVNQYISQPSNEIQYIEYRPKNKVQNEDTKEKKDNVKLKIALAASSTLLLQVLLVYLLIHRKEIPNAPSEIIKYMQRMSKYKVELKKLLSEKDKLYEDYRSTEKIVNTICNRIDKTILKCKDRLSAVADNETIKSALAGAIESKNIYDVEVELKKKEIEDAMTRIKGQLASISENDMTAIEQLSYDEFNKIVKRKPISEGALFEKVDDHYVVREIFRDKLMFFNLAPISFNNVDISGLDFRLTNASINLDKVYAYDDTCKFGDHNVRFHLVH